MLVYDIGMVSFSSSIYSHPKINLYPIYGFVCLTGSHKKVQPNQYSLAVGISLSLIHIVVVV